MPSPRTCTHIKTNGVKCGSPALKFDSLCFFHYRWKHRRLDKQYADLRAGCASIKFPLLENKASIIFTISEIQNYLLAGVIDEKMARTLLYAVQLAIQTKISDEDTACTEAPAECHELEIDLRQERRFHKRPPQQVCDSCDKAEMCDSAKHCIHSTEEIREFERIHDPERYRSDRIDEEAAARTREESQAEFEAGVYAASKRIIEATHAKLRKAEAGLVVLSANTQPAPPATVIAPPDKPPASTALLTGSESNEQNSVETTAGPKLFSSSAQFARMEHRALNEINILAATPANP